MRNSYRRGDRLRVEQGSCTSHSRLSGHVSFARSFNRSKSSSNAFGLYKNQSSSELISSEADRTSNSEFSSSSTSMMANLSIRLDVIQGVAVRNKAGNPMCCAARLMSVPRKKLFEFVMCVVLCFF